MKNNGHSLGQTNYIIIDFCHMTAYKLDRNMENPASIESVVSQSLRF